MKHDKTKNEVVKVFYNSACPICNAGINYQKCRMNSDEIEWNDVHINRESIRQLDSDLEYIREKLHLKDASGKICIGIDAFITLWELSPGESWKASIVKKPLIYRIAAASYNIFARSLYRWNRLRRHW